MRSRRRRFETACRVGAFALLGWLLGGSLMVTGTRRWERATDLDLLTRLAAWTRDAHATSFRVDVAAAPPTWAIDWLAALRHGGHTVVWSGSPPAVAMTVEPIPDPSGGVRVDLAAPSGSAVVLRDEGGIIDTARVSGLGATATLPLAIGAIGATAGAQQLSVLAPDSAHLRSIVVIGDASWEGKFIVAALEERGWPVIARFAVAPNVQVSQGGPIVLDTSRVAAVIAVDSAVQSLGPQLERFVRSGGGLVLAGPSSLAPSVATLAPGVLGARVRPVVVPKDTIGLGATGFYPVRALTADGVALERRVDGVVIAARRVAAGRVLQVGYDDSWRWRMAGGVSSERAHRDWWARVVGSVAYVPTTALAPTPMFASAPRAYLFARLGAPVPAGVDLESRAPLDRRILLLLIMVLLLAEWSSRRLRGLK